MKLVINEIEIEVEEWPIPEGMYEYCDDCKWPFRNKEEKYLCGWHWRPKSGTKEGFPTSDGRNCLKDDELYQQVVETIENQKIPVAIKHTPKAQREIADKTSMEQHTGFL